MYVFLTLACSSSPTLAPAPPVPTPPSRTQVTTERLQATDGGKLVLAAIDAHGGLEPWNTAGSLAFDFDYAPIGAPEKRRYSRSQVDLQNRRAVQNELGDGADATMGWDGTTAWITPDPSAFPSPPAFWATTPFYFVGVPWVLADEGTIHTALDPIVIPATGETRPLPTVKVTYEAGTGDAPDDFYVLHLHPDTHQVLALRYIVSFPAFFPEGGHGPEKILLWSGHTRSDGLLFATHYDSYLWNEGALSDVTTLVDVANIALGDTLPDATFSQPTR